MKSCPQNSYWGAFLLTSSIRPPKSLPLLRRLVSDPSAILRGQMGRRFNLKGGIPLSRRMTVTESRNSSIPLRSNALKLSICRQFSKDLIHKACCNWLSNFMVLLWIGYKSLLTLKKIKTKSLFWNLERIQTVCIAPQCNILCNLDSTNVQKEKISSNIFWLQTS